MSLGALSRKADDVSRPKEVVEKVARFLANPHSYTALGDRFPVVLQLKDDGVALDAKGDTVQGLGFPEQFFVVLGKQLLELGDKFARVFQSHRAGAFVFVGPCANKERRSLTLADYKISKKHMRSVLGAIANLIRHFAPRTLFALGFFVRCDVTMCDSTRRVKFRQGNLASISLQRVELTSARDERVAA